LDIGKLCRVAAKSAEFGIENRALTGTIGLHKQYSDEIARCNPWI